VLFLLILVVSFLGHRWFGLDLED